MTFVSIATENDVDGKHLSSETVTTFVLHLRDRLTVFESAAVAAFEPHGFAATHVAGHAHSDGYIDAILGVLGYRAMIEHARCQAPRPARYLRSRKMSRRLRRPARDRGR